MGKVQLMKNVELDPNYEHSFTFPSILEQEAFFLSKVAYTHDDFLKIKDRNASLFKGIIAKENYDYIKIPNTIDKVRECNYIRWKNDGDTKWYYAFITNSYYVADGTTIVEYELDVVQTFLFDFSIESGLIDREHQDRITKIGGTYYSKYNTLPENINTGSELEVVNVESLGTRIINYTKSNYRDEVVWLVFVFGNENGLVNYDFTRDGLGNGLYCYVAPFNINAPDIDFYIDLRGHQKAITLQQDYIKLENAQQLLALLYNNSYILSVYVMPYLQSCDTITYDEVNSRFVIKMKGNEAQDSGDTDNWELIEDTINYNKYYWLKLLDITQYSVQPLKIKDLVKNYVINNTLITTTTPYENSETLETKLYVYPFYEHQLQVDGSILEIKRHLIAPNCSIIAFINFYGDLKTQYELINYNGDYSGLREGIGNASLNDVPLINNALEDYIANKHISSITGLSVQPLAQGVLSTALTQNVAVGIGTALYSFATKLAQIGDLSLVPQSIKSNGNNGLLGSKTSSIVPKLYTLQIRDEYKKIIRNYFNLYGYNSMRMFAKSFTFGGSNLNDSDKIRLLSRYYFNYIKCIQIDIKLNYNRDYHDKLEAIFKKGITLWHYRTGMTYSSFSPFNYTYENIEVSLFE